MRNAVYAVAAFVAAVAAFAQGPADEPNKWEKAIALYEEEDKTSPPPKGAILFAGSSSIRLWKTAEAFPDLTVINRGFGGSTMADLLHFLDRIVIPYAPRQVVVYEGDNDIDSGKSAEAVAADFAQFFERVHEALPTTRIAVIAIKPSVARWDLVEEMRTANALIRAMAERDPRIDFVDIDAASLGADGKPNAELLRDDGLHLNDAGYAVWNESLRPYLTPEPAEKQE